MLVMMIACKTAFVPPSLGFRPAPISTTTTTTTTRVGSAILPLDGPNNNLGTTTTTTTSTLPTTITITEILPSDLRIAADICIEAFFGPPDRNPIRKLQLESLFKEQMNDLMSRYRQSQNNKMLKAVDDKGYMVGFVEIGLTQSE